ncbi:hypothetical protein [Chitinophaga sp. YR573]|uniref:hypothetical protein n=1 Tax=Chitinophaga sp. YR573 TaxID=1881040 RepID=UPI000B7D6398|nr:hypothetical protein [Chitinophaga sp. YR573]
MNDQDEMQVDKVTGSKAILCPKCKQANLEDRVPRGMFIKKLLWFLPLRRYICYRCCRKSYIWYKAGK